MKVVVMLSSCCRLRSHVLYSEWLDQAGTNVIIIISHESQIQIQTQTQIQIQIQGETHTVAAIHNLLQIKQKQWNKYLSSFFNIE